MLVCLKYCLPSLSMLGIGSTLGTHASTLENSADGDITKLSLLLDQDIRFCMLVSSNILQRVREGPNRLLAVYSLVKLMNKGRLHYFWLLRRCSCGCAKAVHRRPTVALRSFTVHSVDVSACMVHLRTAVRWTHCSGSWRGQVHWLSAVSLSKTIPWF